MSTSASKSTVNHSSPGMSSLKRVTLIAVGIFWVAVGAVGVILPGIPTAGPLILASICLTKSCPPLERLLVRNRFFAAFHQYLDGQTEMPLRAKVITIIVMWLSISFSCWMLLKAGFGGDSETSYWTYLPSGLVILAGLIGTWFIVRFGRSNS